MTVPSTSSNAWQFIARGEATAAVEIQFPLTATLRRRTSSGFANGSNNTVQFTRSTVRKCNSSTQSASVVFLYSGVARGQTTLPGQRGQSALSQIYFWVGGSLQVPANANTGYYLGTYDVCILQYSM
ncbi:MAG: DUF4402 domain-containing protein [Ignavibacteriae bacterium]|nr:DUF4402 domain-containing protein [Ignavibacteriota bacterium]